ncbi:winged helix-turn-helix domain-containing protein [Mumia sp. DW29H23]|uniref:winged helix-turn-helix domain-containing protein n=1 Tax=Mumia sp. DW29H23 TaxID=3421241 RepID=UPI003D690B5E
MTAIDRVPASRSVDDVLADARRTFTRLHPAEAYEELLDGALIIDIRQEAFRRTGEQILGSLVLDRNVLEWRLDPTSAYRIPEATSHDRRIVLICPHGDASSLAVATLRTMGVHRATDVVGGFVGWKEAGLPLVAGFTQAGSYVQDGSAPITIDLHAQEVTVLGRRVVLSRMELIVLSELHRAGGRVVTREELNHAVGSWDGSSSRAVDLTVHRLRRRLGARAAQCIETVRGVGFRLLTSASGCPE